MSIEGVAQDRPAVVTVMFEHMSGTSVWNRPYPPEGEIGDFYDEQQLIALGASPEIAQRLCRLSTEWSTVVLQVGDAQDSQARLEAILRAGQEAARELQNQLWDIDVRYWHHKDSHLSVREQSPI